MQDNAWEERLAARIGHVLMPVRPSEPFRSQLRSDLERASRQRLALVAARPARPPYTSWWLGAAALGLMLAGGSVLAWALRSRWPFMPLR